MFKNYREIKSRGNGHTLAYELLITVDANYIRGHNCIWTSWPEQPISPTLKHTNTNN